MLSKNAKQRQGLLSRRKGYFAETLACLLLVLSGYTIIWRNYRLGKGTGANEIDIIASKHNTLVFVEVKKRKTSVLALESITDKAKERICRSAAYFMGKQVKYTGFDIRFDVIYFTYYFVPHHLKDAWRA